MVSPAFQVPRPPLSAATCRALLPAGGQGRGQLPFHGTRQSHGRSRQGSQAPAALPLGSLTERQIPFKNAFLAKTFESRARAQSRLSVESFF